MSTDREAASSPSLEQSDDGYRRVLLKLSGEVFGGGAVGLDLA